MTVTIIGIGLIGGSMAITLRGEGFADKIIGVDANGLHCEKALQLGLVDQVLPLEEAVMQDQTSSYLQRPSMLQKSLLPQVMKLVINKW
jgi:prephenate dehydrogenase